MTAPERKYALRKLGVGDYLLLSNDGRTLWRLHRYQDGPSYGLEDMPRDRWFWRAFSWPKPLAKDTRLDAFDVDDLSRWREEATMLSTRQEAIDCALGRGAR